MMRAAPPLTQESIAAHLVTSVLSAALLKLHVQLESISPLRSKEAVYPVLSATTATPQACEKQYSVRLVNSVLRAPLLLKTVQPALTTLVKVLRARMSASPVRLDMPVPLLV